MDMMTNLRENLPLVMLVIVLLAIAVTLGVLLIRGGGSAGPPAAPSPDPAAIQTQTMAAIQSQAPTATVATPTHSPEPDTATPTTTITPTSSPTGTAVVNLCDRAAFVEDVTIPDGTEIEAGSEFTKTWLLRNDGTCTWSSTYQVVFASGDQMGGPNSKQLSSEPIAPGETVQVSVNLTAPDEPGSYLGNWVLQNTAGSRFGIGPTNSPFWADITVVETDGNGDEGTNTPTSTATPSGDTATPTSTATPSRTPTPMATSEGSSS